MLKFFAIMAIIIGNVAYAGDYSPRLPVEHIETSASSIERGIRQAAVRVTVPFTGGHGSGSYIKYKDLHLVITAQHVVNSSLGASYLVHHKEESHMATLIYSDELNDIAVLYVGNPFKTIKPLRFNPLEKTASVGTEIFYSGYPSHHKLMSFTGRVAGHENKSEVPGGKEILLQTYGWFGCSGSVVYDTTGRQIGVLYGVDVEYYPDIQVQENMIWVVPINRLKIDKAISAFCRGYQGKRPNACK
tara:strand:- start:10 stop:744 length:735 start_codon:yes stop_codon:yes gene_type:complete